MTVIDKHEWLLYEEFDPEIEYTIIDGTVDLDDEWSPLAQVRLTTVEEPPNPLGTPVSVVLEMFQSVGPELQHTRDLTALFGGGTTAAITAAWGGLTGAQVSGLYDRSWSVTNTMSPTSRRLRLYVTSRTENADGTWTIGLESNAMRLAEIASTGPLDLAAPTVYAALNAFVSEEFDLPAQAVLTLIDDGPIPVGMSETFPTEQRVPIEAGDLLLDALTSSLQANNLLIVDFGDGATLISADWENDTSIALSDAISVTSASTATDREPWFDRLTVVYSKDKTNPAIPYYGSSRGSGVFPPFATILKTRTIQINAAAPFASAAQADIERVLIPIVDRMRNQGSSSQVQAVARYDVFPRATVTVDAEEDTLTGVASRVTFNYAARTMQLDLRQVTIT